MSRRAPFLPRLPFLTIAHNASWQAGVISLSMLVLLAGCASGNRLGGPSGAGSPTVSPYVGPPVALRQAVGANDSTVPSADLSSLDNVNNADPMHPLAYFNAQRVALGLPAIETDGRVAEAAAAHARYLLRNGETGHTEQAGTRDFTGIDVADRIGVQMPVSGASEVLTRYGDSFSDADAVRELFASPYHRGVILFDWQFGGAALQRAGASVIVVDFANIRPTLATNELVAYPYDGQRNVPTAWTDNEVPDPLGDNSPYRGHRVGFPITLSGGPNAHVVWRRVSLTDASGHAVACEIAPLRPADSARNTAICTPLEPLRAHTLYRIEAVGVLTQLSRFTTIAPFSLRWSFTTS